MKLKNTPLSALTCAALLGSAALSQAATTWNFDTPSTDGWYELAGATGATPLNAAMGLSTNEGAHSGSHFIGDVSGNADGSTNLVMWSSPTIQFDLTGGLSAYLRKGDANTALVETDGTVGTTTTENGFRGIALYDVVDGSYLLTTGKTSNSNDWVQVGWTSGQLSTAGVTALGTYQLHLIDQATGGWGHIQMDTVSFEGTVVPEPSAALLGGLGMHCLLRRRRA